MANICKFSNPTALRNVNFVQRGFAYVLKGDTDKLPQTPGTKEIFTKGEDADMGGKTTSFFTRKSIKPASGGIIKMFSSAATASLKDPKDPGINKGPPPQHDNQPVKAPKKPTKDTLSDPKNHNEKPSKN
ncbi:hypothetical protein SUGI_1079390 [Cryptomeria japonica]|nr:hypothetical protein SUGI_1079390 [Cryptomeria japonica]